jgi:hypothetical protein
LDFLIILNTYKNNANQRAAENTESKIPPAPFFKGGEFFLGGNIEQSYLPRQRGLGVEKKL